jgi:alpha-ketoglutarate-dependent taurine dioxygenase
MLSHLISDSRAWRASTIDQRACWYYPLSERCLAALDETIQQLRREPRPLTALRVADTQCGKYEEDLEPVRVALEEGRGFAIIHGMPCERYSPSEQSVIYWLVGQLLGRPIAQNVQGTLLYDVRDTGQDVRSGARYSVTNAATGFHTDNSFGEAVIDYVGLLCLQAAKAGGCNQVVSGYSLHNDMLSRQRNLLERLYEPFHFDRRGGVRPGEAPTVQFPVVHWDGRGLVYRYLRYWIEAGHERAAQALTAAQQEALAALDHALGDADLQVEFALDPGQMFFINNRWIFHSRDAFEDHAESERRRHYVRLWLEKKH